MFFHIFHFNFEISIYKMDKVIRITSQQGFGEAWTNAAPPVTLNLCDFTIPRGMNIDMSKSYIAFNAQITNDDTQPCNSTLFLDTGGGLDINVPISAVIKNASISNNRGNVESIRRVDTLNCAMFGLLDDMESRQNNLNTFAAYNGGRGAGNQTSLFLDAVTDNTDPAGNVVNAEHTSRELARDLKIPLAELFGVANSTAYSTDVFGETRIHLETNFKNVKAKVLGGVEMANNGFDETTKYGAMEPYNGLVNTNVVGDNARPLITTLPYDDWQYVMPFFVGQKVIANATSSGTAQLPADTPCIITGIQYQQDNTTTPPSTVDKKVNITLTRADGSAFFTATDATNLTAISLKAKVDQTLTPTINRAELVLQITNEPPEQQITYDTFTTEEDVGNGSDSFNRAYSLEAETTLWMAAFPAQGAILPDIDLISYRYAINNEEETGNRSIEMAQSNKEGSSLQYDRLIRALDNQGGLGFRNAQLKYYQNTQPQATSFNKAVSVIAETAPATPQNKVLNLNIESTGGTLADIKIYKSVQRTI